ncbi:hypothetical protein KIW84_023450 [Lathyrus oleraceus]|uniref:DUF569 domain-containing protein n=1 Tax=Pisum sativum TaxID=3888 RepID=A0A9D4YHH4_PEA|nr:hypothetical protein KIW84_023450 [Pisum sativum]
MGHKVLHTLLNTIDSSVEWEPVRNGVRVKLKTWYGNFLRGNGGLPQWRNTVMHDIPHRTVEQVMKKMFKCVAHHFDKLWYYDEMNACDIVLLEDDNGTKRMPIIAVMTEECHLYVTHPVSQPDIIDESIISLGLDDEVVVDVGVEFGVNETDVGTTVVQDNTNVGVGFGVNETNVGTTLVQRNKNVGTHVGDDGTNCDIEDNMGDDGANCEIEENVGGEGTKCDIEEIVGEEGTKYDIEENVGEEGTKCDIKENVGEEGINCDI